MRYFEGFGILIRLEFYIKNLILFGILDISFFIGIIVFKFFLNFFIGYGFGMYINIVNNENFFKEKNGIKIIKICGLF